MRWPIKQVDRDAAADYFAELGQSAFTIRSGEADQHSLVQAFARHRLRSIGVIPC